MIPKRIDHDPDCDNYRALALYIADAALGKTPGEKTIFSWYSGGLGDTGDYWQGLEDVELVKALNQRNTVMFTLPGGSIRDTGRAVHFSAHDESIKALAVKFAEMRWGRYAALVGGNRICRGDDKNSQNIHHALGR